MSARAHTHTRARARAPARAETNAAQIRTDAAPPPCQRWLDPEGRRYVLRALQAADSALLGELWNQGLSRPSRFTRFHASLGCISLQRLQAYCQPQPAQGQAFVITQLLPGGERAVAEGRWAWSRQPGQAEISLSVADRYQGFGLGRRLLHTLALAAQVAGAQNLLAQVLHGNGAMQALLQQNGFAAGCTLGWSELNSNQDSDTVNFERLLPALQRQPWRWASRQQPARPPTTPAWQRWLDHVTVAVLALRLGLTKGATA